MAHSFRIDQSECSFGFASRHYTSAAVLACGFLKPHFLPTLSPSFPNLERQLPKCLIFRLVLPEKLPGGLLDVELRRRDNLLRSSLRIVRKSKEPGSP